MQQLGEVSHEQRAAAHVLLAASAQVQAQIVAQPFEAESGGTCTPELIVLRSFSREDVLPEGARFRLRVPCAAEPRPWYARLPTGGVVDTARQMPSRMFARGAMIEARVARMNEGPPDAYVPVGIILAISAKSAEPVANPAAAGPEWERFAPVATAGNPIRRRPPLFPLRDVTMTYRLSYRAGEEFRARYQSGTWRVSAERVGAAPAEGLTVNDWLTGLALQVWGITDEYRVLGRSPDDPPGPPRLGTLTSDREARFVAEGEGVVAGHRCSEWRIDSRQQPSVRVCVTDDGVQLRRVDQSGTMEATGVSYGWIMPPIGLPHGYRRAEPPGRR